MSYSSHRDNQMEVHFIFNVILNSKDKSREVEFFQGTSSPSQSMPNYLWNDYIPKVKVDKIGVNNRNTCGV